MSAQDLEQRARELLAKELPEGLATDVRAGNIRYQWVADAIRAIVAALRQQPAPVGVPDSVIVLLNHLETLMDEGKLEEDAIPIDMWNAVSMHNFALAQQPAPVDLEQFREAVEQWKMLAQVGETVEAMPVAFRKKPEEYTARIAEADRLLSIIDSAPVEFRNYGNSEAEFIADHADSCTACGGSGHKADQQPAPVVDDAMRELIDAADKAKRAYWLARNSAAGLTNYCEESANSRRCERELDEAERIYRDSGFEAALARAQGVQS